jgi:PAS domain S-box-containing protein
MTTPQPFNPPHGGPAGVADLGALGLVVLESLVDPIYVLDGDWRITFCNAAFERHMQMPKARLVGACLWDTVDPTNRAPLEAAYARVRDSGQPDDFVQASVVYPDRMMDVRLFPVFDGVGVLFRDVTRRVAAERALATSEEHLRRALSGADMGHWRWDARSDRMFMSERMLALYGLQPEHQGMHRPALRALVIHPDDIPTVKKAAEDAQADQSQYETEYRVMRGGEWRWMRVMGGPHIVDGVVVGVHGLIQDIHERKLAGQRLQAEIEERERAQQRQTLLIHELNHRVKNILAMVQAVAQQTLSTAPTPEAARKALDQRLLALARAHDVLTRESWDGAELDDLVSGAVAAHETGPGTRFRTDGPRVRLGPKTAVSLSMVLHELATNAVKYGALSDKGGWVALDWTATPTTGGLDLRLHWAEHDGPAVKPPERTGFGTRLITQSLAAEQGSAELIYEPQGLVCRMSLLVPTTAGLEMGLP